MSILLWFAAGLIAGLVLRASERRLRRLATAVTLSVYAVVAAQGLRLGATPELHGQFETTAGAGALFAIVVSLTTLLIVSPLARRISLPSGPAVRAGIDRALLGAGLRSALQVVVALVASTALGWLLTSHLDPAHAAYVWPLNLLLLLIGLDTGMRRDELRSQLRQARSALWVTGATLMSATVAGALLSWLPGLTPAAAIAGAWGSGFYSVTGPVIGDLAGPQAGAIVFVGNLLRESFAICVIGLLPAVGVPVGAAAALGGATSMDSSLPFLTRAYGTEGTLVGIGTGLLLSLLVPVAVPSLYWLLDTLG